MQYLFCSRQLEVSPRCVSSHSWASCTLGPTFPSLPRQSSVGWFPRNVVILAFPQNASDELNTTIFESTWNKTANLFLRSGSIVILSIESRSIHERGCQFWFLLFCAATVPKNPIWERQGFLGVKNSKSSQGLCWVVLALSCVFNN